jgi:hypothetical protein
MSQNFTLAFYNARALKEDRLARNITRFITLIMRRGPPDPVILCLSDVFSASLNPRIAVGNSIIGLVTQTHMQPQLSGSVDEILSHRRQTFGV